MSALATAESLLTRSPGQRDALLFVAIAQRNLGRVPDALKTLAELERYHPAFSRLHEERGHCYVATRQAPSAIAAFQAAVNVNNALPASWSMLEGLYRMTGKPKDAEMAASQVATLRNIPPEIVAATSLYLDGDLDVAEPMVRDYLIKRGDHVEAMRLLARIGIARKVFDDAELLLAAVLQVAPDYRVARAEYAEVLVELQRYSEARRELDRLMQEDPQNRQYFQSLYATACVGLGEHERAIRLYKELLNGTSADADVHLSIAHAQKTLGQQDEAIASYRRAAASRPTFGDAYWSLANLKTYRFTADELDRLKALQSDPKIGTADRSHVCFALGKALEDQRSFAESFHYYERGNALKRAESRYRPEIIENNTRQQIEVCTSEFFERHRGAGVHSPDPIFIVGLPRSGSTLLEQILASHSQVEGTQELANVQQIVATLRGRDPDPGNPRYPRILTELSTAEFRQLGERYIEGTRVYRATQKPFFIDKMPNNFRHLGLIHLMLPNAKIIDARREPIACCFSNLKQLFARGQEFTYSIADIARYYRTYLELMEHWDRVLPGRVLRVQHEDVVDDLEGSVRRILEFCGLEFEPQCIEFHKTVRSVRTASSEQVRQPIYREGLEQWKNFEPWLGPLVEALGDAASRYRDGAVAAAGAGPTAVPGARVGGAGWGLARGTDARPPGGVSGTAQPLDSREIGVLVEHVNRGRLAEAESNARTALASHPNAGILWKVLSVVLVRQGKDALQALRRAAELMPDDAEALRNLGAALHDCGEWAEASTTLQQALAIEPNDTDTLVDAADALRGLGRARNAVPLYQRALELDPQLVEGQNNLGNAFLELGQHEDAVRCYRLALALKGGDAQILCNLGNALRQSGRLDEATTVCRQAIAADPASSVAHDNLGLALAALGRRAEAAASYRQALKLSPTNAETFNNLGNVLFESRQVTEAAASYQQALKLQPDSAPAHLGLAFVLRQQRRPAEAEASCQAALAINPDYVEALCFLGELRADRGQFSEAEKLFQRATEINPDFHFAFASIAMHRKMTPQDAKWLQGAAALLAKPLPLANEISLRYALGKYFDDTRQYDAAFSQYRQANELTKRYGPRYNAAGLTERIDRIISRFDAPFVRASHEGASTSEVPVLIVGMPRSGTSLTEQILASHPAVFGAGEVTFWNAAYDGYRDAEREGKAGASWLSRTAGDYLDNLDSISSGALRVVDKMPANFMYSGLVHAVFPRARIIHMQRHPFDTCLSIYFQNFFNIGGYANDLDDLAHYYSEYVRVTDHWRAVLPPTTLLEVPYEALIADPESWTRRMLDFIGLPWDPKCLEFQHTDRAVITASRWQVRQKINTSSAGRWHNYEKHVTPLRHLLAAKDQ